MSVCDEVCSTSNKIMIILRLEKELLLLKTKNESGSFLRPFILIHTFLRENMSVALIVTFDSQF